jgi:hypothetical protein
MVRTMFRKKYLESLNVCRPLLQKRFAESFCSNGIVALVFPTTPAVAPPRKTEITIAGQVVNILTIGKNVGFLAAQIDLESVCQ